MPVLLMFSRQLNDNSRYVRLMIVGYATTWSITSDHHSDDSRGVIYNCNIFTIEDTPSIFVLTKSSIERHLIGWLPDYKTFFCHH